VTNHHDKLHMIIIMDPIWNPLSMWVISRWANMFVRSLFGGAKLIHGHWKWWTCDMTIVTSTCTGSLIQTRIYCHATIITIKNLPMEEHFLTFILPTNCKPNPRIILIWGLKVCGQYQLIKDPNMSTLKWLDQLA
jgi:hypothetical protein